MVPNIPTCKRSVQPRTKVKTGCATCRIRKVKCDETKPSCQRCVKTGRTCDGYESPFRLGLTSRPIKPAAPGLEVIQISSTLPAEIDAAHPQEIAPQDIELLGRYFSTKTMFHVKLGCNEEAKQILQASLTDPPIRHAVSSLKALREHLESSGHKAAEAFGQQIQPSHGYDYGLQQYCVALGGLASKISSPTSSGLKSALLCCQIFISIEQVRGNYTVMAKHMVQGLSIMNEYRARPNVAVAKIPALDVFIIKLFAAPCKFADRPAHTTTTDMRRQSPVSSNLRIIAPDMRKGLTSIAATTLDLLDRVARADLTTKASFRLLSEKASLLDALESWFNDLELILAAHDRNLETEPLSMSFLHLFHRILKVVLLGTLDFSQNHDGELMAEIDGLYRVAGIVEERSKAYRACSSVPC